jgi:ABC-2 type transport system permease protein
VLYCTPFPYQMYFPVSIYTGHAAGANLARGLLAQAGWVVAAWLLAVFAWRRGLRKYAAVGG